MKGARERKGSNGSTDEWSKGKRKGINGSKDERSKGL